MALDEETPLIEALDGEGLKQRLWHKKLIAGATLASVAVFSFLAGAGFMSQATSGDIAFSESKMLSESVKLSASNSYTALHGTAGQGYIWLEDGSLVEPQRDTALLVSGVDTAFFHTVSVESCDAEHKVTGLRVDGTVRADFRTEKSAESRDTTVRRRQRRRLFGDDGMLDDEPDQFNDDTNLELDDDADEYAADDDKISSTLHVCDFVFPEVGTYIVRGALLASSTLSGSLVSATVSRSFESRYVRRDLRKLVSKDREAFFRAAKTIFDLSSEEGIEKYGSGYKPIAHFLRMHLEAAVPDKHHDYMHDGMGFFSQHVAITNTFEAALQVVDPSIALPFWDYTQDFAIINATAYARPQSDSKYGRVDYAQLWKLDVWGSEFFGSAVAGLSSSSEEAEGVHTVSDGLWAYTRVPRAEDVEDDDEDSDAQLKVAATTKATKAKESTEESGIEQKRSVGNAMGLLRSPWNLNPSPFVTRYHQQCASSVEKWPTCRDHYKAVFEMDSLTTFMPYISYTAHGGVHLMVGGSGGDCQTTWSGDNSALVRLVGSDFAANIKYQSTFVLRNLWRYGLCTDDDLQDVCELEDGDASALSSEAISCKLACRGCDNDSFSGWEMTAYNQWWDSEYVEFLDESTNAKTKEELTRLIFCDTKWYVGDHIESSSPVDISFWPIHPTLERLLQYKNNISPFDDYNSWWDATYDESDAGWGTEGCKWGTLFNTDCNGHYPESPTVSETTLVVLESSSSMAATETKVLTNREILDLQLPHETKKLPYVYETFTWEHCESDGVTFPALV